MVRDIVYLTRAQTMVRDIVYLTRAQTMVRVTVYQVKATDGDIGPDGRLTG